MSNQSNETILETYFQITKEGLDQPIFTYSGEELLKPSVMKEALHISQRELAAFHLALPASFLANTLFGLVAAKHYYLALENIVPRFPLPSFALQAKPESTYLRGCLHIPQVEWLTVPDSNREAYIKEEFLSFYQQTLNPLLERTAEMAGIKPEVLWSQYGSRMKYTVDVLKQQSNETWYLQRLQKDYELLCGLDPAVFNIRKNPYVFRPRYVDNPWNPDQPLLLRSSCCLYDQREQGEKCYNCPKLPPQEREAMRERIEKELSSR